MPGHSPAKPSLPAERTLLSWERSAFGFLVGGVLVLLRDHGPLAPGRTPLAVIAALLGLVVVGLGYRRSRQIKDGMIGAGRVVMPAPRFEVLLIGGATIGFAMAMVVVLLA